MTTTHPKLTPEDARLLFSCLDAAADDGLMRGTAAEARWDDVKRRATQIRYQAEGGLFWELLQELDLAGRLDGSWIQARWRSVKTRVEAVL